METKHKNNAIDNLTEEELNNALKNYVNIFLNMGIELKVNDESFSYNSEGGEVYKVLPFNTKNKKA